MAVAAKRGALLVYLGAAPGVGKTFAMLDEARRRQERGTDVVVGFVETHGRANTEAKLAGLVVLPRRTIHYRGASFTEMDTDAIIERGPAVVLVDELAHTNVPGSPRGTRAEDVELIRAAGIDVITTVNIQHLESLNDEVQRITGVRQRETIPDEVVRTADQIQLVDMSPQALRRRLAHGNVYRADQVDASLSSYFRVGNLTALRELALLWLADRVDDALDDYRRSHAITDAWPTKERIVVAVTGGAESETLVRRGARIAQRAAGSELLVVHVLAQDGLSGTPPTTILKLQELTTSLGGTFHGVTGDDVAPAVVQFARGANATMIVVGVSRHGRLRQLFTGSSGSRIAELAESVDVHLVTHDSAESGRLRWPRWEASIGGGRLVLGWLAAVLLPVALTVVISVVDDRMTLSTDAMAYLALTVAVAMIGGLAPAVVTAVISFGLLNWFFTPPVGQFTVAEPQNVATLLVFLAVAVAVATVVDLATRRAAAAARARADATTVASLARSVLTGTDTAAAVTARLRETFGQRAVGLLLRSGEGWTTIATDGELPPTRPGEADDTVNVDRDHVLALSGPKLAASDRAMLEAYATHVGLVLEHQRLREREGQALSLERADATATAVLRAVSHDLRTPLATIRATVDGLSAADAMGMAPAERAELTTALAGSTAQLEHLIDHLLDLSRIQSGMVNPILAAHSLEEILPVAVAGLTGVELEVDETVPLVQTDPGLLERVVANVIGNAVRHSPADVPVRVSAQVWDDAVVVLVVDRGPGVPDDLKERMFAPFQRLGDRGPGGVGLGLAVARGLAEAIGATLRPEDTPGGGLTMVLTVPRADAGPRGTGPAPDSSVVEEVS